MFLLVLLAEVVETTAVALGTEGGACVTTVEDEPVVGIGYFFLRKILGKCLLHTERGGAGVRHKSYAVADAKDVGIDCHACLAPNNT